MLGKDVAALNAWNDGANKDVFQFKLEIFNAFPLPIRAHEFEFGFGNGFSH